MAKHSGTVRLDGRKHSMPTELVGMFNTLSDIPEVSMVETGHYSRFRTRDKRIIRIIGYESLGGRIVLWAVGKEFEQKFFLHTPPEYVQSVTSQLESMYSS